MFNSYLALAVAAFLVPKCASQQAGWDLPGGQVNTTMCQWQSPRAAVVRDTLYIDGGYLWWQPGMADGQYGSPVADGNPLGLVYLLNFSTPFNTSSNLTNAFTTISKAANGGASNNIGPQYYDGAMFANDYEWFTYGGLLAMTDAFRPQPSTAVAAYQVYSSGPLKDFNKGYILDELTQGVTRYVTHGGAVSVPSESLGFYFGGLRSSSFGPIFYDPGSNNQSVNADQLSSTLIEIDMNVQAFETWTNTSLPTNVPGRANAEVVWVPVSDRGILVAIGGVVFPSYAAIGLANNASSTRASQLQSPHFMSTVAVYDIAKKVWYEQNTTNAPGQMTQGCTVVASAQDGSSHNIYWYGGFDGLDPTAPTSFNDAVYVLSIPSFKWIKVNDGTPSHARAGHKCTKPYPDQMLVIGGYPALSGEAPTCVEGGIIQIYNLSSNVWIQSYNPKVWSNYTVPSAVQTAIGGSATGAATQTSPSPGGFSDAAMAPLFKAPYDSSKIKNWYPYKAIETPPTNRTILPTPVTHNSGTPGYLAPVLGVVLGLFGITLVILAVLLWRRRKYLRSGGTRSETGTMDNRRWVDSWLRGTPADAKAPTMTTDDTVTTPYSEELPPVIEAGGSQVHEMMDTSMPPELHDTGTGFVALGSKSHRRTLSASPSQTSQSSQNSSLLPSSPTSPNRPPLSPHSPSGFEHDPNRIASGVSNISETDRGHMRGISETSVSTDGGAYATPMEGFAVSALTPGPGLGVQERPSMVSPITPPEGGLQARDYVDAGQAGQGESGHAKRRSNFSEGLEENVRR